MRVRLHGLLLAAGSRIFADLRDACYGGDPDVDSRDRLRIVVRPVDGLRNLRHLAYPRGYDRTGSTDAAIVGGLARTGRLVTCAALVLMVTFLSLSIDPNQIVKIQASTLAVGIIIDAVIIRTLLVPALVSLMGALNWWAPPWLPKRRRAPAQL